jgi:hypothetical protein
MRLRWRVRSLMAGVALSAAMLGLVVGVHRRRESLLRLAAYHSQAEGVLFDEACLPYICGAGLTQANFDRIYLALKPRKYPVYRAAMYHHELSVKYRYAAETPWLLVADDPPAPPRAYPKFEPDPYYYKLLSGEESGFGIK